jgi:hypothetical protein
MTAVVIEFFIRRRIKCIITWAENHRTHVYLTVDRLLFVVDSLCQTGLHTLITFGADTTFKTAFRFGFGFLFIEPEDDFVEISMAFIK